MSTSFSLNHLSVATVTCYKIAKWVIVHKFFPDCTIKDFCEINIHIPFPLNICQNYASGEVQVPNIDGHM